MNSAAGQAVAMAHEQGRPKALIGASIPRSGHHYLQRTLSRYFREEIFYCEWYTPPECCKQVPCTRRKDCRVIFQKSHDWDFSLNRDVAAALYVVQYRQPVPEALSDRELATRDGIEKPNLDYRLTEDCYSWWLAGKALYYRGFHDKWFRRKAGNAVYLNYEHLLREPAAAIEPVIQWVSGGVDEDRLSEAIAEASASRGGRGAVPFAPRIIENSRHFNRDLLAPYEAYVLERCPAFEFQPEFSGSYRDHSMYGLILAQDEEEPLPAGEKDRLGAALRRAPGHPELMLRLARRELDSGNAAKAIGILEETLARSPFFGSGYRLLQQACRGTDQPLPASFARPEALFASTKHPDMLVEIAEAMLAQERTVNAVAVLSTATVLHPDCYRAYHVLARVLAKEGRWAQAREYADKAAELEPDNKKNVRLLTRIGKHIGQQAA